MTEPGADPVEGSISAEDRLRQLMTANRAIVSELSLPAVLRTIVDVARTLVGARYAALGVIAADGSLEQFIHLGMTEDTVHTIGQLPKGRGLLGALVQDPHPIRLPKISDDDRSSGFPPGHPPMDSFLGVPIRSRSEVFGNLYLTGSRSGEFTSEDEDLVLALAATAGIAIENARLYDEYGRRQHWLVASAEISGVLLTADGDSHPLQLIVDTVKRLADADVVTLVVPSIEAGVLRVAVAAGEGAEELRDLHYSADDTLVALAMDTGRGVRVGSIGEEQSHRVHLSQVVDVGAVMVVPLSGATESQGAIMAGRLRGRQNFTTADLDMAEVFANHAAIARELVEARADQQRLAVLEDRARIARDLHDHVIQRLFGAGLSVQSMATVLGEDDDLGLRLGRVVEDIDAAIGQIRTSIFQLDSAESSRPGARAAVMAVVRQVTPVPRLRAGRSLRRACRHPRRRGGPAGHHGGGPRGLEQRRQARRLGRRGQRAARRRRWRPVGRGRGQWAGRQPVRSPERTGEPRAQGGTARRYLRDRVQPGGRDDTAMDDPDPQVSGQITGLPAR